MKPRLVLTGNEPRRRHLFDALASKADVCTEVLFDDIDLVTKFSAAALSFSHPRSEWWGNYQMHPLIQRRRQRVLADQLRLSGARADVLMMWGSWFPPFARGAPGVIPYINYIDQSRSLEPLAGEAAARFSRRKRSHALQAITYEGALAVMCMSQWARNQTLEAHRLQENKVLAVGWGPCAVDLSQDDPTSITGEPMILHVSNDFRRKGVDYLIETAARVRSAIPQARFVVIGRDSSGLILRSESNVQVLGPIYDKGVLASYFRRAALFFLPHRFDRSPHVLVEAMSAGLPLVASAQGGAVELISGTGVGVLCTPGNIEEYADAIVGLVRNESLRAAMGLRALALMREHYNWQTVADRILGVITRSLAAARMA